jgi:hypothetical protein
MTTVVTAYYPIRSKFSPAQYLVWAQEFLRLEAPILLFTEPGYASLFQALRTNGKPLSIVEKPFQSLSMWRLYRANWERESMRDHEMHHSAELYALWAEKASFIEEAIRQNPHNTSHFFWCDIGAFREPITPEMQTSFPRTELFPTNQILLCSVQPLKADDWKKEGGIVGNFRYENRIVGGLWGGSAAACLRWRSAYEAQLIRYFSSGRFAGKDQSVILSAYLEDTSLARVIKPTTKQGDHWFFLEYALSAQGPPLETDTSYIRPLNPPLPPPVSVQLMGGLGNQLFQVAAAWSHARRTGSRLLFPTTKAVSDGRPLYWDSVLYRFGHLCTTPTYMPSWWEPAPTMYAPPPPPSSLGQCLRGYLQSPRYFETLDIDTMELRSLFRPSAECLAEVERKYGELLEMRDRIVVVHARRGDYCKTVESIEYHGPLSVDYYKKAFEKFPKDSIFLLVSDEPMWWMNALVHISGGFTILMESDEILTFALLQQFRKFILANSSFSWWAAWMADAEKVVAPATWFGPRGPQEYKDIYCANWERI